MFLPIRLTTHQLAILGLIASLALPVHAFQPDLATLLEDLQQQVRQPSKTEIESQYQTLRTECRRTIENLSQHAVGYALSLDLQLPTLETELSQPAVNLEVLQRYETRLQRIVPGKDQIALDRLRKAIGDYRRAAASTEDSLRAAEQGLSKLKELVPQIETRSFTYTEELEIRDIYRSLHHTILPPLDLAKLQQALAYPNAQTRVRKSTIEKQNPFTFDVPVKLGECNNNTQIAATGSVKIHLHATFPNHPTAIPIMMHVTGDGQISATADRTPAHIIAAINANASGTQPLEIGAKEIGLASPNVKVDLNSQLQNVRLDGHLNRVRLLRNLLSRVAQQELAKQDRVLSQQIEDRAIEQAKEQGYSLAHKINGLLNRGLWNRLESLNFSPTVKLSVDSQFIHNQAMYAYPNQLGALKSPQVIPAEIEQHLDVVTAIHESTVNNVMGLLQGTSIDDATVRGIWQVQLKLTRSNWDLPTLAHIPSKISFSGERPIQFQWVNHTCEINLPFASGRLEDQRDDLPPCDVRLRYRLGSDQSGFIIQRDPIEISSQLSEDTLAQWTELINRFFPESLHPIPQYRSSILKEYLSLRYLNAEAGWLTIGIASLKSPSELLSVPQTESKP